MEFDIVCPRSLWHIFRNRVVSFIATEVLLLDDTSLWHIFIVSAIRLASPMALIPGDEFRHDFRSVPVKLKLLLVRLYLRSASARNGDFAQGHV